MKTEIVYEWANETIVGGEISDCNFTDTLAEISKEDFINNDIALVRNEGNESSGLTDRNWAYIKHRILPDYFCNADGKQIKTKVPQKFHKELAAYLKSIKSN